MREYIHQVLYDNSGLLIGRNDKGSIILGQDAKWVVLDKQDVKKVALALAEQQDKGVFDGFDFRSQKGILSFNQYGDSVYVERGVFQEYLQCFKS